MLARVRHLRLLTTPPQNGGALPRRNARKVASDHLYGPIEGVDGTSWWRKYRFWCSGRRVSTEWGGLRTGTWQGREFEAAQILYNSQRRSSLWENMTLENAAASSRIHVAIDTPSIIPTVFAYIHPPWLLVKLGMLKRIGHSRTTYLSFLILWFTLPAYSIINYACSE